LDRSHGREPEALLRLRLRQATDRSWWVPSRRSAHAGSTRRGGEQVGDSAIRL